MLINQSFIFAAGRGERMRPITDTIPKPLVKIKNKAIIDYAIEKLNKIANIQKIIINGFYLADEVENHLKKLNNPKITFSRETAKIETGGGLFYAMKNKKFDEQQPILLVNGDILWQDPVEMGLENNGQNVEDKRQISDIEKICQAYNPNDCDILLGLKKTGEILGYEGKGDFDFDPKTGALSKKPNQPQSHVFVGIQVVNPQILNQVSEQCFSMSYFYKKAVSEDGKVNGIKGIELAGRYFHIGDVPTIALVENKLV